MTDHPNPEPDVLPADLRQRAEDHLNRAARYASPIDTVTCALLGCGYALCALYDQADPDDAEARTDQLAFEEWGPP
ncbi:hypothetical protein [Amycolatopsis sp. CFH S0078]|uniref:hypothetical protein n=1 Tax=Amycolatopsis sp. CFH S0078 TaxID=1644108 RepID=UPI00106E5079|nr:hypothetical protein [Amycolatopsis sp. CFH S0078]